jgi:hypothetical protein
VGRCGNQPADVWLKRPSIDLMEYADELAEIMREEANAMRDPHAG